MPEVQLIRVPPGWSASEEGYFLNAVALAELTAAAKTYRLERDAWERAYYELVETSDAFRGSVEEQVAALREQLDAERSAWRASLNRSKRPGIGVFAGVGHRGEAVAGVGVVWRIF